MSWRKTLLLWMTFILVNMRMSSMFRLPPWKNTVPSQVGANGKTRSSRLPLSNQSIDSFQKVVDESSPIVYSWAISQDSIVRVCVEIFTPTLTSTLPVAELAEVPQSISESVAELAEALSAPLKPVRNQISFLVDLPERILVQMLSR